MIGERIGSAVSMLFSMVSLWAQAQQCGPSQLSREGGKLKWEVSGKGRITDGLLKGDACVVASCLFDRHAPMRLWPVSLDPCRCMLPQMHIGAVDRLKFVSNAGDNACLQAHVQQPSYIL